MYDFKLIFNRITKKQTTALPRCLDVEGNFLKRIIYSQSARSLDRWQWHGSKVILSWEGQWVPLTFIWYWMCASPSTLHPLILHPYLPTPAFVHPIWFSQTGLLSITSHFTPLFKYLSQRQLCDNLCSRSGYHSGESHDGLMLCCHCLEWNLAIYSNMDGHREYHTKWSKPEKDKRHMISLICGI